MIIGVTKEIKNNENRIGLTPASTAGVSKSGRTARAQAPAHSKFFRESVPEIAGERIWWIRQEHTEAAAKETARLIAGCMEAGILATFLRR